MINFHQSFASLILIAASGVVAGFALTRWKLRHMRPTARSGALLLWCGSWGMLTNAFEMASPDLPTALFWNRMEHIGVFPVPTLWLIMALQFTGYDYLITLRRLLLLCSVWTIGIIFVLTNEYHHLFVSGGQLEDINSSSRSLHVEPGPLMLILYAYGYLQVIVGTYLLTRKLFRSRVFRWQGSAVLLGVVFSVTVHILDWTQTNPIPEVRLTPLAWVVAIPLFILTLARARRADIVPVARGSVLQIMHDGVIVLDVENRIIDLNPAAEQLVSSLGQVFGKSIDEAWPEWSRQINFPEQGTAAAHQLQLKQGDEIRYYDISSSDLNDWQGRYVSRVMVLRDVTERVSAEERLRKSLAEKEILLKEVHHRVKNNLQIISSLLNLQAGSTDDPFTLSQLQDSQARIRSMALIHERLYRSDDLTRIELGSYLRDLTASLMRTYRGQAQSITLQVEAGPVLLDLDTAIPCGLIVNELVSNALTHAFPSGRSGQVGVEFRNDREAGLYRLSVWDDGIGLPASVDIHTASTLGLRLVAVLTQQMNGRLDLSRKEKTTFEITFAGHSYGERNDGTS